MKEPLLFSLSAIPPPSLYMGLDCPVWDLTTYPRQFSIKTEIESAFHVLWDCEVAKQVWRGMVHHFSWDEFTSANLNFYDWF
ncbi:hypothetical protein MANES_13G114450v8 [Manihot esculenta]|uniref:Uncharacterized protein n=1 Tax=Manihot esculenta TaxID=3983 RepID=A0ACB7GLB6_MANES|nr:hypothetical protein MANES_13G114450v8 [Manihot esculenta]